LLYNGEPSAFDLAGRANRVLQALAKTDTSQEAKELQEETENLEVRMGELVRALGKYGESLEHDPGKLERTMERIDLLDRLKKKYGKTLSEVLSFLERAKQRLDLLESSEENLKNFDREIEALEKSMELKAREISKSRKQAALKLEKAIQRELESLEMKGARFEVKIAEGEFNARGKDQIEFYLSANPGEELKPLAKVASGGESSRLQLALKKYFSQVELVSTFIFDEIDSGIGARLAPVIGEKLSAIAKDHAVIAITHLAPVASQANCHWQALKQAERGKTVVKFVKLEGEARLQEIAKMLSGKKVTDASLKHAEEILNS
jgi:DNA repair protein RecN (Recombination protein N)